MEKKNESGKSSKSAVVVASKHRGVKTGMRVMEFQDHQLARQPERKLTDLELLDEMKAEFPHADGKIFTADLQTRLSILQGVRNLFNLGKHSKGAVAPKQPVGVYTAEDRKAAKKSAKSKKVAKVADVAPEPPANVESSDSAAVA